MTRVEITVQKTGDIESPIPWVKENPVNYALAQRRHEVEDILLNIIQRNNGILEYLPDDIKEIIKVPKVDALLDDI